LILSRYAGLGSHRYPLGFSGDTVVSWKSLDFQPYFTNCAANSGYTWWSHDIGGHMHGVQDDELYLRWLQYGVFSPINRLHSSNSDFCGKEPWKRSYGVEMVANDFLRLRHKMIPFLYSANYRTHKYGEPICMPMYYRYDEGEAYELGNQYIFGGQLLVSPITKPADKRLNLAPARVWLPKGRWTDIFNGRIYEGDMMVDMYRDIDSIPVLAPEGAIIPMYRSDRTNDLSREQPLEIHIWRGNGHYELYEDDGETVAYRDGKFAITTFDLTEEDGRITLTITPPRESDVLPESREMYIKFRDILTDEIKLTVGREPITVELSDYKVVENPDEGEMRSALLTRVQGSNDKKSRTFKKKLPKYLEGALAEFSALKR
jgi:alpha-glucosidase (family GH31 glycosyl hydrolase)